MLRTQQSDRSSDGRGSSVNANASRIAAVATSLLLVTFLVVATSRAAFVGSTANIGNSVHAATVVLADNDATTSLISLTDVIPGTAHDRCMEVTYSGTLDVAPIKLYMGAAPTGTLGQYLNLIVDIGADTTDAFGSCTSFVSTSTLFTGTIDSFRTTHNTYATGLSTWDPAGGGATEIRTVRFRLEVQNNNAAQGLTSGFGFTWEAQS
ncbi:MAG: hypothetical protein ACKV2O_02510 [Acidimicrobiales bacterium]